MAGRCIEYTKGVFNYCIVVGSEGLPAVTVAGLPAVRQAGHGILRKAA
jgi:hypothetical protein